MLNIEAGLPNSFRFDFRNQGGTLIADANSVYYTLRDGAGVILTARTAVSAPTPLTNVVIPILASKHTITPPKLFEIRHLGIEWESEGVSYSSTITYRVSPFALFSVTAEDVRVFLGLTEDDLLDSEVDLYSAYFQISAELGTAFDTALQSGTNQQVAANDILLFHTVLQTIPGCRLRVVISNQDGALKVDRLKTVDFEALTRSAQSQLDAARLRYTQTATVSPTLIFLTTPTDPITGA